MGLARQRREIGGAAVAPAQRQPGAGLRGVQPHEGSAPAPSGGIGEAEMSNKGGSAQLGMDDLAEGPGALAVNDSQVSNS